MSSITQERLPLPIGGEETGWRVEARHREAGRQGLAAARAALEVATRRAAEREHANHPTVPGRRAA